MRTEYIVKCCASDHEVLNETTYDTSVAALTAIEEGVEEDSIFYPNSCFYYELFKVEYVPIEPVQVEFKLQTKAVII